MPAINRADRKYQILGIHGSEVLTVEGDVARVRMYIGGNAVDEDFPLPKALTVEQQLDTAVQARIAELVNARIVQAAEQGKVDTAQEIETNEDSQ